MKKYYDVFYTKNSKKREKVCCRAVLASNKDEAIKKVSSKWSSGTTKQEVLTASFSMENDRIEHLQGETFSSVQELECTIMRMLSTGMFDLFKDIQKDNFIVYFDGSTHAINCIKGDGHELKVIHAK